MRIAFIITRSDRIGGAHVHVRDLALLLQRLGHEVLVATGGRGPFTEELSAAGLPWHDVPHLGRAIDGGNDLRAALELWTLLRGFQPDLVSTHSSKAGCLGRLVAHALGLPAIFTAHGWAFTPGVPARAAQFYRWVERCAAPFGTRIITVSEFDRQLALRHRVAPAHRVVTVHNGMPDLPPRLWAAPERAPVRLTMVARFEPQKDHGTLLRALAGLTHLPWELELIGDGPLADGVARLGLELGIADRIGFRGACRDVAARLAESQLFLLVTNWEGFPRSILEAMRAGLPVVASDVGGVRESVRDQLTGSLFPRGDVDGLRQRLETLITNPGLRARLGTNGRREYEARFTLEHTLRRTLGVYRGALAERAARPERVYEPSPDLIRRLLPTWRWAPKPACPQPHAARTALAPSGYRHEAASGATPVRPPVY